MKPTPALLCSLAILQGISAAAEEPQFPKRCELEGFGTHYWVEVPAAYLEPGAAERKFPLLVGLHGSGDTGKQFAASWWKLRDDGYIVAAPKSPGVAWTGGEEKLVLAMIEKVKGDFRIDPKRISVVAFSAGSFFGMPFVFRHPETFNALVAMGGGSSVQVKPAARALRVYLIAGEQDPAKAGLEAAFESLKKKGVDATLRIMPGQGHVFPPLDEVDTIRKWFRAFSPEGLKEKELLKLVEEARKDAKAKKTQAAISKLLEVTDTGIECPALEEAGKALAELSEEASREIERARKLSDQGKTDAARAILLKVAKDYAGLPEANTARGLADEEG